jgi:hypothetical protein
VAVAGILGVTLAEPEAELAAGWTELPLWMMMASKR